MLKLKKKNKRTFSRYIVLVIIMFLVFGAIGGRLYYIQITSGQYYSESANNKSHKEISQVAPRGVITDKSGTELATNVQSFDITYTETDDNDKLFYSTMSQVFKILDSNGEVQTDDFALKINPYRFEFNTTDTKSIQTLQLRFLKDRGIQEAILKKSFKSKKESDLTDSEKKKLNTELLKLTPEQVYKQLLTKYDIIKGVTTVNKNYTLNDTRRYLIIKDAIKMQSYSGYKPVTISSNVKKDTSLIFWQKLSVLPGINVSIQPLRYYPYGQLASAVLGYTSKISSDKQETYSEKGYDVSSDYVGASGIESALEDRLRGNTGAKVVKVDNQGRITNELASRASSPGENVQLTIDKNLQYTADTALDKEMATLQSAGTVGTGGSASITSNATRGAAIAIDIHTGAILALSSRPGFDPNIFANPQGLSSENIKKFFNPDYEAMCLAKGWDQTRIDFMFPIDTSIAGNTTIRKDSYDFFPKYLYNYATMSLIPPGSTFKPITAIAGLETGVITPSFSVYDTASFDDGKNFKKTFEAEPANGDTNLTKAIAVSSNPYFMTVAKLLREASGNDIIAQYAWKFGLGAKPGSSKTSTGIEISENFGQVYNTESQKNLSAITYLMQIEQYLINGKDDDSLATFTKVDLYDHDTDSTEVKNLKKQIKDSIKNSIKTGAFTTAQYNAWLQQLISLDPYYKDKNLTATQLNLVTQEIYYQAVSKGYAELKGPFNIYNASIGQGMSTFTPLQLVDYIATLVNGGNRYKLHLVDKITDSNGKVISDTKPEVLDKVNLKQSTIDAVEAGMAGVTSAGNGGDGGTAAAAFEGFPMPTGGKTGSATSSPNQQQLGRSSYGFYVGFAPLKDPQIAVVAVVFDGGYGSYAANIARAMYECYFKDQLAKDYNYTPTYDVVAKPEN